MVFQLEVNYKVDRLLTGLTAQQKGTAARWYSNKISLSDFKMNSRELCELNVCKVNLWQLS